MYRFKTGASLKRDDITNFGGYMDQIPSFLVSPFHISSSTLVSHSPIEWDIVLPSEPSLNNCPFSGSLPSHNHVSTPICPHNALLPAWNGC